MRYKLAGSILQRKNFLLQLVPKFGHLEDANESDQQVAGKRRQKGDNGRKSVGTIGIWVSALNKVNYGPLSHHFERRQWQAERNKIVTHRKVLPAMPMNPSGHKFAFTLHAPSSRSYASGVK
jgi:hypothetical protein